MPDITMCKGRSSDMKLTCNKRSKCYRYTAKPSSFSQSWFTEMPCKEFGCEYFMENKGDKIILT